jgi:hypothetical protein
LQTDDESLFLLQELIVELPPVSSPVNCIYAFGADRGADRIDHFEKLVVLSAEKGICLYVFRLIRQKVVARRLAEIQSR